MGRREVGLSDCTLRVISSWAGSLPWLQPGKLAQRVAMGNRGS